MHICFVNSCSIFYKYTNLTTYIYILYIYFIHIYMISHNIQIAFAWKLFNIKMLHTFTHSYTHFLSHSLFLTLSLNYNRNIIVKMYCSLNKLENRVVRKLLLHIWHWKDLHIYAQNLRQITRTRTYSDGYCYYQLVECVDWLWLLINWQHNTRSNASLKLNSFQKSFK